MFLVADTQFYKRLCPLVRRSVRPSIVRGSSCRKVKKKTSGLDTFCVCLCVCGTEVGVWMVVGCPCPPVRNDIVTPRHLLIFNGIRSVFSGDSSSPGSHRSKRSASGGHGNNDNNNKNKNYEAEGICIAAKQSCTDPTSNKQSTAVELK